MRKWLKDTLLRMAWTFAEVILGFLTVGAGIGDIPWNIALSVAAVAVLGCFLKQVIKFARANLPEQENFNEDEFLEMIDEGEWEDIDEVDESEDTEDTAE